MQNIGLMMTHNEEDIIETVMTQNKKYFDHILVLDGSTDKTPDIIQSFDNVSYFIKDQDLYPQRKVKDGIRQFLLEKAQEMFPQEGWFTLLHGDEIMIDDPNLIAQKAEDANAEKVNWHSLDFFLHESQKDDPDLMKKEVQERCIYYMPGTLEIRQFKNKPGIFYNINQHNNVLPQGIGYKPLLDFPILKHYVVRSPDQILKSRTTKDRMVAGHSAMSISDTIFSDKVFDHLTQVRKYEGDFGEFEPSKRPHFFFQWVKFGQFSKRRR
ncbi:MAG: hypothetical protein HRT90_06910 [Candidatus Margulisbacteria bacterium]|nr:hypothetical protein [Candidatus Margulisiibacteriota bacterium]